MHRDVAVGCARCAVHTGPALWGAKFTRRFFSSGQELKIRRERFLCQHISRYHGYSLHPYQGMVPVQSIVECSRRPSLRSADTADYVKHRLHSKFGERCFSYAGPAAWNSLPHSIELITDTSRFKQLLKSHLFRIAF